MNEASRTSAFLALYAGDVVSEAKVVALSCDPSIVERFLDMLPPGALEDTERRPGLRLVPGPDPFDAA
ncbi:MAG: hypothetical protein AVDCRST_MAG55-1241 [uncultured Rubrobacteraceae bacterium]|jgi:hypothetical protein|uniref:Uncharacterized protein n=1 Tax=uncultured Rubrobacteraceae bacterium TaxID=349277 RepID=A0A6J4PC08_9ACTN|nr:MAG: hypothetical protein AVDCRST_MAG55-1241 [uncultured Rubrobacteraceae bacterium]